VRAVSSELLWHIRSIRGWGESSWRSGSGRRGARTACSSSMTRERSDRCRLGGRTLSRRTRSSRSRAGAARFESRTWWRSVSWSTVFAGPRVGKGCKANSAASVRAIMPLAGGPLRVWRGQWHRDISVEWAFRRSLQSFRPVVTA